MIVYGYSVDFEFCDFFVTAKLISKVSTVLEGGTSIVSFSFRQVPPISSSLFGHIICNICQLFKTANALNCYTVKSSWIRRPMPKIMIQQPTVKTQLKMTLQSILVQLDTVCTCCTFNNILFLRLFKLLYTVFCSFSVVVRCCSVVSNFMAA